MVWKQKITDENMKTSSRGKWENQVEKGAILMIE